MQILLTTTGAVSQIVVPEFGGRTYVHPLVDYDITQEFDIDEIRKSVTLQNSIDSGYITLKNGSNNADISDLGALQESLKHNYSAILNPDANDDSSQGYSVGSLWINTFTDSAFICVDPTTSSAVWKKISPEEISTSFSYDKIYAYNMFSSSGTFNSLAATAAGSSTLYSRWIFRSFNNGQVRVCSFNTVLPPNYVPGTNISFSIVWTANVSSGNAVWHLGLSKPNGANKLFGDSSSTEWIVNTVAGPTVTGYQQITTNVTFNGAGLVSGDTLSFIIMRQGNSVNDTISATVFVNMAEIGIQIN